MPPACLQPHTSRTDRRSNSRRCEDPVCRHCRQRQETLLCSRPSAASVVRRLLPGSHKVLQLEKFHDGHQEIADSIENTSDALPPDTSSPSKNASPCRSKKIHACQRKTCHRSTCSPERPGRSNNRSKFNRGSSNSSESDDPQSSCPSWLELYSTDIYPDIRRQMTDRIPPA